MIHIRIGLDPCNAAVQRDLADVYALHRRVMSLFPPQLPPDERILFRLERSAGWASLVVQSLITRPGWAGPLHPLVIEVEPDYHAGQSLAFRLVANPTRRDGDRGPRVAVEGQGAWREWLARKGDAAGFRVRDATVADLGTAVGYRPEPVAARPIRLRLVQFDGALEVTDPGRLATAVRHGIGSAKGFGCGLLSLGQTNPNEF